MVPVKITVKVIPSDSLYGGCEDHREEGTGTVIPDWQTVARSCLVTLTQGQVVKLPKLHFQLKLSKISTHTITGILAPL